MKRIATLAAVILAFAVSAPAQQLSKAERDRLVNYLKQTQKNLQKETKGLTPEQWKFKQGPDRWSVQDCLEHLTLSEDFLRALVTDRVLKQPATPEKYDAARARAQDDEIIKRIADRSQKAQAPEQLRPSNKWATTDEMWKAFKATRKITIDLAKTQPDLRTRHMDSPIAKDVDAYQWLLFLSAHTERHTKQIQEVKADPNYPKKSRDGMAGN